MNKQATLRKTAQFIVRREMQKRAYANEMRKRAYAQEMYKRAYAQELYKQAQQVDWSRFHNATQSGLGWLQNIMPSFGGKNLLELYKGTGVEQRFEDLGFGLMDTIRDLSSPFYSQMPEGLRGLGENAYSSIQNHIFPTEEDYYSPGYDPFTAVNIGPETGVNLDLVQ